MKHFLLMIADAMPLREITSVPKGKLIQLKMKSCAEDCPRCKKNDSMVPLKVNIN